MSKSAPAALQVKGRPDGGNTILLSQGIIIIGRAPGNDIVVDEAEVSRQHGSIRGEAGGYWIADLDSRYGTFVNNEMIGKEPQQLRNWDRIQLGALSTHWAFHGNRGDHRGVHGVLGPDLIRSKSASHPGHVVA